MRVQDGRGCGGCSLCGSGRHQNRFKCLCDVCGDEVLYVYNESMNSCKKWTDLNPMSVSYKRCVWSTSDMCIWE